MDSMYLVVGMRWVFRNGHYRSRKKYVAVSPDRCVALNIAKYMQENAQDNYEYFVDDIDCYSNFNDFLYDECEEIGY